MIRAFANGIWFYAEPATRECQGCIFDNERYAVCRAAGEAAVEAGMPDCEARGPGASSYIYRLDLSGGRQMDLLENVMEEPMSTTSVSARNPAPASAEMLARRDAAVEQIKTLLAGRRLSTFEVAGKLVVSASTAYRWLTYMKELGEAFQIDDPAGGGRKLWVLGRDPVTQGIEGVGEHAERAWIVPARQVGMHRDPLIEAPFGPAGRAA